MSSSCIAQFQSLSLLSALYIDEEKALLNRKVFRLDLNDVIEFDCLIWIGNLFQRNGAAF